VHAPDVLILDDPFGNLDPRQRQAIERLIDAQMRAVFCETVGKPLCFGMGRSKSWPKG
jgi:ABC-type transporter Mla maintaining outer membrane lipid asymmetry ATPase subunit MlaF